MKTKTLILKDVPRSIEFEINHALIDYSVAVCRVRDNNPNTFTPLGSGTFVVREGMHGILTAHHCLHRCNPEVRIVFTGVTQKFASARMGKTHCYYLLLAAGLSF